MIVGLFLGLLALMPIEPFCSERPYTAARPPLTRRDNASSYPQVRIDQGLSSADDHIHAGLTRVDVTRWLNPAVIISSLLQTTYWQERKRICSYWPSLCAVSVECTGRNGNGVSFTGMQAYSSFLGRKLS